MLPVDEELKAMKEEVLREMAQELPDRIRDRSFPIPDLVVIRGNTFEGDPVDVRGRTILVGRTDLRYIIALTYEGDGMFRVSPIGEDTSVELGSTLEYTRDTFH